MTAPFFVTDEPVGPSKPTVQFLSIRDKTRVRLLSRVFKVLTHWVNNQSIPHLLNGECKHCELPKRWTGYAAVSAAMGDRAEDRILIVAEGSLGLFTDDLIGMVLTLNRVREGRFNRLVIDKRERSDLPLPKTFDVVSMLRAWWRGVEINCGALQNLAAPADAPQLR